MLFLREYNIEVGFNPLEPSFMFNYCSKQCYSYEYNIEVVFNPLQPSFMFNYRSKQCYSYERVQ